MNRIDGPLRRQEPRFSTLSCTAAVPLLPFTAGTLTVSVSPPTGTPTSAAAASSGAGAPARNPLGNMSYGPDTLFLKASQWTAFRSVGKV